MPVLRPVLFVLIALMMVPGRAHAQAAIAGAVKDASGAVLPGVTVEASSEALIEKVRSAVTDGTGQYRIVDLRPGTYSVTFTLTGFSTVKREGIELSGSFTAAINADMKVGTLTETITVTGETPIVDVQSVRRQTTLSSEVLTTVPTARSWAAVAVLIPAITTQAGTTSDIQVTPQMTVFGGAGGRGNEGRMQVDGLNVGATLNGGGVSTYIADIGNAQEVTTTASGGLGEAEVGGPAMNIVPKTGGNTIKGALYLSGVPKGWVDSNYSDELRTAGLTTPGALIKQWDFNLGIGGPIKKDRLWYYFATARDEGQYRSIPGIYPNLNAGDPTKFLYAPDTSRQAQGAESWQIGTIRLTLQASQRNKFNFYWDEQLPCNGATYSSTIDGCRKQPESGATIGAIGLGGLTATDVARNGRIPAHHRFPCATGHVDLADDESASSRSGNGDDGGAVGTDGHAGQSHTRTGPDVGAVRRRLRGQWEYRQSVLPLRELGKSLGRGVYVARVDVVRDGRAQHEVRPDGRLPGRRPPEFHQRPESRLPGEQWCAERVDPDGPPVPGASARAIRCALRAGTVDARPADTPGGAALR